MSRTNYSPSGVIGVWKPAGSPPIDLRGGRIPAGNFAASAYTTPERATTRSAHGHTMIVHTADDTVSTQLGYQAGSPTATLLWNLHMAQEAAKRAGAPLNLAGPLEIQDPATGEFTTIPEAVMTAVPSSDFGDTLGDRVFTFAGAGVIGALPLS